MGALMLNCPTTGREFSTGINVDEETFKRLPDAATQAHCPYCGVMHDWWIREARWIDNIPSGQWVEAFDRVS